MEYPLYFNQKVYIRYNNRMWVYPNPKIWHRLNEQVIQREFEVSTRHRRANRTQFIFSFKPKGWFYFINSGGFLRHFGGCDLLLNVHAYYGEERRRWQPSCHTRAPSCWRGLRFVPGLISCSWKSGTCGLEAFKVGRLSEEFLILSDRGRTMTACHGAGWMRVRVLFDDAGKRVFGFNWFIILWCLRGQQRDMFHVSVRDMMKRCSYCQNSPYLCNHFNNNSAAAAATQYGCFCQHRKKELYCMLSFYKCIVCVVYNIYIYINERSIYLKLS